MLLTPRRCQVRSQVALSKMNAKTEILKKTLAQSFCAKENRLRKQAGILITALNYQSERGDINP